VFFSLQHYLVYSAWIGTGAQQDPHEFGVAPKRHCVLQRRGEALAEATKSRRHERKKDALHAHERIKRCQKSTNTDTRTNSNTQTNRGHAAAGQSATVPCWRANSPWPWPPVAISRSPAGRNELQRAKLTSSLVFQKQTQTQCSDAPFQFESVPGDTEYRDRKRKKRKKNVRNLHS
jgi:hypothetical protein